jgi:protein SCO1
MPKGPVSKGANNKAKTAAGRPAKRGGKIEAGGPAVAAKPLIAIGLGCALLFAAVVAFTSRSAPPVAIGGPFQLTAQTGKSFTDQDMLGRPYLVFFGYTNCPDICHTTLFEMSEVLRALGPDANIGALFVTVDPERDTPQQLKEYLASFDPRIVGLTGAADALQPMLKEYRIYAKKTPGANGDYGVDHNTVIYLMDKEGRFVSVFNVSRKPGDAARELQRYL